jgi:uncharacterized protein YidB (DUF937 family)
MGLFDSVAGAVLGQAMGDKGNTAKIAMEMFNQYGGLSGILAKFQEGGLADIAASWVGNGANAPISSKQITDILGSGAIAEMAAKFGLSPDMLSSQLADHLPAVIDKMTPNGEVSNNKADLLKAVMGMMK